MANSLQRIGCSAIAAFALVCLSSCAVPLAPGYKIEKQSITVRFVPGAPPHLAVRAEYRLANVGNSSLDSIEVGLPGGKAFGRQNLQVTIDNRKVTPEIARGADADEGESSASEEWPVVWRIPFSPAWHRKQKRTLIFDYDLTAAAEPRGRMYVSSSMFYLNDSGWFPDPLAPKSLFAKDLVRPSPFDLEIIVPPGFLAAGSGEPRGVKKSSAEAEYRFRLRKDGFDPFVIAGQYVERRIATADGTVAIWTLNPMPTPQAQSTATQISAAAKFYSQTFGPLPRSMNAIYDIEYPGDDTMGDMNQSGPANLLLPGVVYDWFYTPNKSSAPSFDKAYATLFGPAQLSSTWFDHLIRPRPEAWKLSEALVGYASDQQDERTSAHSSRIDTIISNLSDYDGERANIAERPIASLAPNDPEVELQIGGDKLTLFFYALEDKCGRDNLNRALAHMVSALRFQQYGYDDFRSAVEQECHQDLGPFFRSWLNEKGIPADFRARYGAAEKKN
ncbi:MAG TPA: hypothetical protein VJN21_02760 [Candidatus Acidoferrales bacterium]|nr:hypothetical protein [Candidatus Acidoferrales bacterium]